MQTTFEAVEEMAALDPNIQNQEEALDFVSGVLLPNLEQLNRLIVDSDSVTHCFMAADLAVTLIENYAPLLTNEEIHEAMESIKQRHKVSDATFGLALQSCFDDLEKIALEHA